MADSAAIVATVHSLVAWLAGREPEEIGCQTQLAHAHTLVKSNGSERQRHVHANGGLREPTEWLIKGFEEPPDGQT